MGCVGGLCRCCFWTAVVTFGLAASFVAFIHWKHFDAPAQDWFNAEPAIHIPANTAWNLMEVRPGVTLNVMTAGPEDGTPIFLLHGFPESALMSWHKQLNGLTAAGFRVVAPDMRGYNTSIKPQEVSAYVGAELRADVVALFDTFGVERALLVGHDWGGAVAWDVTIRVPDRVARLVVCNLPHPKVFLRHLTTNYQQLMRSWYMFWFQLPFFPEARFSADGEAFQYAAMRDAYDTVPSWDEVELMMEARRQPGSLTGMINWYRAIPLNAAKESGEVPPVSDVPVRVVWGTRDVALGDGTMADESQQYVKSAFDVIKVDASHFVQHDAPEVVTEAIVGWMKAGQ